MSKLVRRATRQPTASAFQSLLRHWRTSGGLSQFTLAEIAGISTRHLSFLETGRSLPSGDMVRRLAESLELAPADANALLLAAGFAPSYAVDDPATVDSAATERMLDVVLAQQPAIPALVIDDGWNIRRRNAAAVRLFGEIRPAYGLPANVADNALHILCHPDGLRRFMPNWQAYVEPFLRAVDREVSVTKPAKVAALRDAVHAYPGVPECNGTAAARSGRKQPPLTMQLRRGDAVLSFYTAFTTFAVPSALDGRTVRIESLYPTDAVTAQVVDGLAQAAT